MNGDAYEAAFMTSFLTGAVVAAIRSTPGLTKPVVIESADPAGKVEMRLASGMLVTVTVHVEPIQTKVT